jgi:hypothetical protein
MKSINLTWIIPVTLLLGFIVGVSFVDYDFNMTMDDNTRDAIQSLNQSIGSVPNMIIYTELLECKDQLRNETIEKMELVNLLKNNDFENQLVQIK